MVVQPDIAYKLHPKAHNFLFFAAFQSIRGLLGMQIAYVHGMHMQQVLQQILPHSMQLAWMAFPFPYANLKPPFCTSQRQKIIFSQIYAPYQLDSMCICRLLHYSLHTSSLVLKIKNCVGFPCHVTRSMILDLPYTRNTLNRPFSSI